MRYARNAVPFAVSEVAAWLGLGIAVVRDAVRRLVGDGRLTEGDLRPVGWVSRATEPPAPDGPPPHYCDPWVLSLVRRRSLAALRSEVEPVSAADYARFLPAWQNVGGRLRGIDGVLRVAEQLAGAIVPASALESLILPARVTGYTPAMLDELVAAGEVIWQGAGDLSGGDGWLTLIPADLAGLLLHPVDDPVDDTDRQVLEALGGGGAHFARGIADASGLDLSAVGQSLWRLAWAGRVTTATLAAAEEAGRVRRGYFVEGLGASQFGGTGAVDRLRASSRSPGEADTSDVLVLAACDPANPYGAALPWPLHDSGPGETRGHQPARKAGALVVLVDGELALYVERGGKTLLSFSDDDARLVLAARALAESVHAGALGKLTVEKIDGTSVMGSDHPLGVALATAGFQLTPKGLRLHR